MSLPAWICDLGHCCYAETGRLQRRLRSAREAQAIPDTLLLAEHHPVISVGYRTEPHELAGVLDKGLDLVPTDRGGKATYLGPGIIIGYPVLALADHGKDLRAYVRLLEQVLIDTVGAFGIEAGRRDGYPGVWVEGRKIASIGVRVTRWVCFHGISLNVDCALEPYQWFSPCGIPDVTMTSIASELGDAAPAIADVRARLVEEFARGFGFDTSVVTPAGIVPLAQDFEPDTLFDDTPLTAAQVLAGWRPSRPPKETSPEGTAQTTAASGSSSSPVSVSITA